MIDRASAPEFVEPSYFEFKKVQSQILKGGIPFHFINAGTQDILRIELIFKAGKWFENKNGISFLTTKMLLEGTNKYTSNDISRIFEQNGAFYEINPGLDHITFTIYALTKNLDPILDLIAEIINYPSFPEKELETVKKISIQNLKVNKEKNSYLASRAFRQGLFGSEHPYGNITEEENLETLTRDDLFSFFSHVVKDNFEVLIAGNFNDKEHKKMTSFFDGYKKRNFRDHLVSSSSGNKTENIHLPKDKSLQSSFRIGNKTIPKSNKDFPSLLILNEILGGYFGSRLMQKIREEKGYTYGIHSSIVPLVNETYFVIGSDIIKKFNEDALKAIYSEIDRLSNELIPNEELSTVKNYFKGNFLSSVNNVFSLADKFKSIYFHNLDYTYYQKLFEEINDIDSDELRNVANKYLPKDSMLEVIIG